jgi:hypothetical protein
MDATTLRRPEFGFSEGIRGFKIYQVSILIFPWMPQITTFQLSEIGIVT